MFMMMDSKPLHIILREVMDEHGLKTTTWPVKAGLANGTLKSYFKKIENGEEASLTYRVLDALAGVIGMSGWQMLGGEASSPQILVSGLVQAGEFASERLLPREKYETIPEHLIDVPGLSALEVKGDSMDLVFPEGSVIFCQNLDEFRASGGALTDNTIVAVERLRRDEREYTVKRMIANSDGTIGLHPQSLNNMHRPILFNPNDEMIGDDLSNEGVRVAVIGVVVGAHAVYHKLNPNP